MNAALQGVEQVQSVQQLFHGGALPAGEDQAGHAPLQITALADLKVLRPQPVQHGGVLCKGPLEGQNPNGRHLICPAPP